MAKGFSLGGVALDVARPNSDTSSKDAADIITFIESPWGLNQTLYPVQRIIIKAHYGLELDDNPYGIDLDEPVPTDHPKYTEITHISDNPEDEENGYYKYRVIITDWRRKNRQVMTEAQYLRYLFDQGRCNIREVIPGHERREMVLSIGRRSGKCVTGDTLIYTDRGLVPIRELGDPNGPEVQPLEIGVVQEAKVRSKSAYFYNGGVRDVRRIKTSFGYHIAGTDNHRIKVLTSSGQIQWRYMADLQVGDVVCINRGSDFWSSSYVDLRAYQKCKTLPDVLDPDWGLLLGYMAGVYHTSEDSIAIYCRQKSPQLSQLFHKMFGHVDKHSQGVYYRNSSVVEFLADIGVDCRVPLNERKVPSVILRSPKKVVAAYLRGLFEGDGSVEDNKISYVTSSPKMSSDVQTLLANFGIISCVRQYGEFCTLSIYGRENLNLFAYEIGFDSLSSRSKLKFDTIPSVLDADRIPYQKETLAHLAQDLLTDVVCQGSADMTYDLLRQVVEVFQDRVDPSTLLPFHKILDANYFFDPVVSIEEGREPVFDLNVPDGHSFVANAITNHNTQIASFIAAYETYKLILKGDPQKYYGLPQGENIGIISVATDKDQAGILYQKVSGYYKGCPFFSKYTANNTMSYARFQTPVDIERYGRFSENDKANATLRISFKACRAKGLRGPGNIVIILDEMAHFVDEGQSSAADVYNAITPSTSAFSPKDPNNSTRPVGDVEGRIISISSPLGRQGQFYALFQIAMTGSSASKNMLAIQAPTWEVNPTVPASEFEKHYLKDPVVFDTEYGGSFTDRTRGWIDNAADLISCVNPNARPAQRGHPRYRYFVGIDFALAGDGSAIAIGHLDEANRIVVDLVDTIRPGMGKFRDVPRLEFDDVADWVADYGKKFGFSSGIFDQWAGIPFEQALAKRGLKMLKKEHFLPQLASQVFRNFKDMMYDGRLVLYDWPKPEVGSGEEHCSYIAELLELQAEYKSKYVTLVEAPKVAGKHDDQSDALVRMVWVASQSIAKPLHNSLPKHPLGMNRGLSALDIAKARAKARLQGGSSPDRRPNPMSRGRIMGRY